MEVDAAGSGTYTWTKYNKDGAIDTSWGTSGKKTGKTLSVSSSDVATKATFMVGSSNLRRKVLWKSQNQFTIYSLNDVATQSTAPENPYKGQLWVDTSKNSTSNDGL